MKIEIGSYDRDTRTVPVSFEEGGVTHSRTVNACLKANGHYDPKATKERVDQVAAGVAAKIAAGVLTNPPVDLAAE